MSSKVIEIKLPIRMDPPSRPAVEMLPVAEVGPNCYRLVSSPGMVEGLAADDLFAIDREDDLGYKVIRRGGNVCAWFFFDAPGRNRGPEADRIREAVEGIGGRLDGGGHCVLVFTIPVSAGFPAIADLFDGARERIPGSTWMYGNVYDPKDGHTPLGWWDE